jgi:hypothetical protein
MCNTRFKNHVLGKKRFAAFRGSQQYNVFQVFFIIDFHGGKGLGTSYGIPVQADAEA